VDAWLNRRHGPGQAVLIWLHLSIPAIMVGSALWSMVGPGTPALGIAFVKVVAWSALAAVPLTGLIIYLQRTRTASGGKQAVFSWPTLAAMVLLLAVTELNVLTDQRADWPRIHRAIGLVTLPLTVAAVAFTAIAVFRHRRRGTRPLDTSQSR
jgi:FtsH-binding integral membrane protein